MHRRWCKWMGAANDGRIGSHADSPARACDDERFREAKRQNYICRTQQTQERDSHRDETTCGGKEKFRRLSPPRRQSSSAATFVRFRSRSKSFSRLQYAASAISSTHGATTRRIESWPKRKARRWYCAEPTLAASSATLLLHFCISCFPIKTPKN